MDTENNNKPLLNDSTALKLALEQCEERFMDVIALTSEYYWEQDDQFRFTRILGSAITQGPRLQAILGKTRWELRGTSPAEGNSWDDHKKLLAEHKPFINFRYFRHDPIVGSIHLSTTGKPVFDNDGNFQGYRGITQEITEAVREERLLALSNRVSRILSANDDLHIALEAAIKTICEAEGWKVGRFWKVDQARDILQLELSWYARGPDFIESKFQLDHSTEFRRGIGLPGWVWQNARQLWVPDISNDKRVSHPQLMKLRGWTAAFLTPVTSAGEVIGVLGFYAPEIPEPNERLLQIMGILGAEIGHYHENLLALAKLRTSESRFRGLIDLTSDGYWEQDTEYRFTRFEGQDETRQQFLREHYLGKRSWETGMHVEDEHVWERLKAAMNARESFRDLVAYTMLPDGTRRYTSVSGQPVYDSEGKYAGYRGLSRDVTLQKQAEERIRHLATHDRLTGLPNREMLSQLMNRAIQTSRRYNRRFAILFIDLDGFKQINDTLGHKSGDELLIEVTERLNRTLRASDVIARQGGDEFVVLVHEIQEENQVAVIANNILAAVSKPHMIHGKECTVSASIGICIYSSESQDEQTMMKHADIAMYLAKERGKNNYQFYTGDISSESIARQEMEDRLRHAIARNELYLLYQAKVEFTSGAIKGVEALLRWDNPVLGMVSPLKFIPVAEQRGLMVSIGKWVLRTACAQVKSWQTQGLQPLCVAINLSQSQISDPNFHTDLETILKETNITPEFLELEVTENMLLSNTELIVARLAAIKHLGVRIAIANFGSGYTSLAQLKNFSVDTIKVDKSFIHEMATNRRDLAVTEAIIGLGRNLGLQVVAEGVESAEQQALLKRHSCDQMQGYYFSKPVAPDEFAAMLLRHHPVPRT